MSAPRLRSVSIARASSKPLGANELALAEQHEFSELAHETRRRDWIAGRRAAKRAISKHYALAPADVRLAGRTDAPPVAVVRATSSPLPLSISISHHDGVGLAAVADRPARIGVDLARLGEIDREHCRYFLTAAELSVVDRVDPTVLWALKEAAWKALSLPADRTFASVELVFDESDEVRGLRLDSRFIAATARTWRFSHDLIAVAVLVGADV
jgi:4'-phosphopantetheinyl transferase EntD